MFKKISTLLVATFATVLVSNAQVYVGGGLGFGFGGGSQTIGGTSTDMPSGTSFYLSPMVGYSLDDDFSIGMQVDLSVGSTKWSMPDMSSPGSTTEVKESETGWGVAGFARYTALSANNLSLILHGKMGFAGTSSKTTSGGVTVDGDPTSTFSISATPVLSYSLTSKLSIETWADFLGFEFKSETEKSAANSANKSTENSFELGLKRAATASIGLVYTF